MSAVNVKTEIQAPIAEVWKVVMDPDRLKDWVTIHRAVKNVSANPLVEGSTMDQVLSMRGVSFRVSWTVSELEEPHLVRWEGRGPAHSRAAIRYELSPHGDSTVFEYTNEFNPPGGRLGGVASRVIVGAASEREAKGSLARLKALLES
jgi:uncharacterized protein YndB with AHSA1/START domain